jgi:hypothetical protein
VRDLTLSSTRGFFIGQLIDDIAAISHQVDNRCRFGFTDLNRMLEDFFRDVINILEDGHLRNLNATRSNEPGLDLGDEKTRTAFQITSLATSAKINSTLEKITPEQAVKFDKIRVLIIGAKQGSYTLDSTLCAKYGFTEADIWDTSDLSRMAISLPAPELQRLHRLIADEVVRVRVELEMPAPDGKFPTSLEDYIEKVGKPTRSDGSAFFGADATQGLLESQAEAQAMLDELAAELASLPRISREFFAFLLSRSEERQTFGGRGRHTNADLVGRLSSYPDTDGELRFLMDRHFVDYDEPDEPGRSPYWRILLPGVKGDFYEAFFYFAEEASLDMKRVIVSLDFSAFGPPPPET